MIIGDMLNDKQQREIFHILFLERLLKTTDPKLYAIKGGCNLRFFYNSPRYSEDLDLDVFGGSVETHKKNGYKILNDSSFRRVLNTYGIEDLVINDPNKAKHTQTTQRFRCRLVNKAGEALPTKVEYSRRTDKEAGVFLEPIRPELVRNYNRRTIECPHYTADNAVCQKVAALANRSEVQARDPFDLYILYLSGHFQPEAILSVPDETRILASENLLRIDYDYYTGQVVEYLEPEARSEFATKEAWNKLQEKVLNLLNG